MAENVASKKSSRWKRGLKISGIVLVVLLLAGGALIGFAEHETAKPEFCGTCHIMGPYYDSWHEDIHGTKLGVACVECHYAPGERTTFKAKFRGLSQVTSYFSGRYGASRPRAHVSNLSCTSAKCHGDNKFMDKPIVLGNTVKFIHSHHLQRDDAKDKPSEDRLAELAKSLREQLGDERFVQLETVALEAGNANDRYDRLVAICQESKVDISRETLMEFSQLHHRRVRVAQLRDLQCTNCHSYQSGNKDHEISNKGHFTVRMTSCYTCHFNNEGFNTGTNSCLMCHSPPRTEITVHAELTQEAGEQLSAPELVSKAVKMNHTEILANKVSCFACHADAVQGDAEVTRRDCERCHDQASFFVDWKEPFTLDLVEKYHAVHIEQQRAKCNDCHLEIKHKLQNGEGKDGRDFLQSALSDCSRCHPKHHQSQVELLLGRGGIGVPASTPNLMFGSRTNCTGCHIELSGAEHGGVIKATQQSCIGCHGDRHGQTFEKWKLGLELVMTDAEDAYKNARDMLAQNTDATAEARQKAEALLQGAESDLRLVKLGNGLHNVTYAMELLDSVTSRCQEAMAALMGN